MKARDLFFGIVSSKKPSFVYCPAQELGNQSKSSSKLTKNLKQTKQTYLWYLLINITYINNLNNIES